MCSIAVYGTAKTEVWSPKWRSLFFCGVVLEHNNWPIGGKYCGGILKEGLIPVSFTILLLQARCIGSNGENVFLFWVGTAPSSPHTTFSFSCCMCRCVCMCVFALNWNKVGESLWHLNNPGEHRLVGWGCPMEHETKNRNGNRPSRSHLLLLSSQKATFTTVFMLSLILISGFPLQMLLYYSIKTTSYPYKNCGLIWTFSLAKQNLSKTKSERAQTWQFVTRSHTLLQSKWGMFSVSQFVYFRIFAHHGNRNLSNSNT